MDDLAKIPTSHLNTTRLIVIGCAPANCIKDFKKETNFQQEVYCDPNREVYAALGLSAVLGGLYS